MSRPWCFKRVSAAINQIVEEGLLEPTAPTAVPNHHGPAQVLLLNLAEHLPGATPSVKARLLAEDSEAGCNRDLVQVSELSGHAPLILQVVEVGWGDPLGMERVSSMRFSL